MANIRSIYYGDRTMQFSLAEENISDILVPKDSIVPDAEDVVLHALDNPIGCGDFYSRISKNCRILIICDDNTRLTPAYKLLPPLLERIQLRGVPVKNISILIASGTHRAMATDELVDKLGRDILERFRVLPHYFRDKDTMVDLGITPGGTPVSINKHVLEADMVIGVGSILPHHVPGFSGGAKIVQPGVCGEATTAATHLMSARQSEHSLLGLVENPVRAEMEDVADLAGVKYIFNAILDRHSNLIDAFFGDIRQAFREGVCACTDIYSIPVKRRTPIVLTSSNPCDIEFWQAHKTLYSADMIVEEGGMVIIVTPCPEGIAVMHPDLPDYAGLAPEEIDRQIDTGQIENVVAGSAALQWSKMRQRTEICLVSEHITPEMAKGLGFSHAASVDEALKKAFARYGAHALVNLVMHGPDTLPLLVR